MTLILTIANSNGVYQSSDYQLTDPVTGAPVSDLAGSKQLNYSFLDLNIMLALTGVAAVQLGSKMQRTIDYVRDVLKLLPHKSGLQTVCETLASKCQEVMRPYRKRGVLTLVLSAASNGKPFQVAFISNADWSVSPPSAKNRFSIDIREIRKPFWRVSGYRDSVPAHERALLKGAARKINEPRDNQQLPNNEVTAALQEINATAARNSRGWVSEECWVTAQFADGEVGVQPQSMLASRKDLSHRYSVASIWNSS
jgi:hypothetical protein